MVRPELTTAQKIEFLDLFSKIASLSTFERKLNLSPGDVEFYKKSLDVETPDEARILCRRLRTSNAEKREAEVVAEQKKVKDAEAVANKRLKDLEAKRMLEASKVPVAKRSQNEINKEDAKRQREWAKKQDQITEPKEVWRLPLEGTEAQRAEAIDRFRREIMYHGLIFCNKKYGATAQQVKFEAKRLGLKINWDIVHR